MSEPLIVLESLSKSFGGLQAVSDCSFQIASGSITGLIGPNGAGKTTVFNMIAGALKPTSGRVRFESEDITGLPTHVLFHRGIVRTFQIPHEFGGLTVLENLLVVPADQPGEGIYWTWFAPGAVRRREFEIRERALETLDFLKLGHLRNELARNLSGGQKKLLELGRAMMADPKVILLDEPGAGVNPTLLAELADMIRRLNSDVGYTICLIEHNMDMIARLCDPVIVMAEGRVLAEGHIDEIRRNKQVLDAYLGETGEAA
jgi:branched-chain amino acid transport system ATP-binding protein